MEGLFATRFAGTSAAVTDGSDTTPTWLRVMELRPSRRGQRVQPADQQGLAPDQHAERVERQVFQNMIQAGDQTAYTSFATLRCRAVRR